LVLIFSVDIYIARGEEQFGPYPLEQVRELLDQGALLPEDLAFHEGLENWTPLAEVIAKQSTPPVPPSPPALPSATVDSPSPAPDPQPATDPTVEPQLASVADTQPKPKKQVPVWLTIVILVLIVGGGVGYGAWYVFFKPNPEYSPTKWDKEDPSEEPGIGQSSTSENQNTGQPGGLTGPVIPSKPEPTPKPTPTPPSPSDPLARNILGKRLVCKTNEEVELIMQFAKDGTFGIGTDWQGQFSQHRETVHYSIDGLKVRLSDNGRENGDVTFPTDNPKAGDQISFGPEQKQITATILRIEPAKAFEISSNTSTGEDTTTTEPTVPEPVIEPKKLTPAQVEEILVQEIGSWRVKGNITTLDPKTGTVEVKEFEDKLETRWKEKGKSTISSFGAGMGQNLTGTTEYDSEMEWFVWRVQAEGRPETVSKNIYDPTTKTYHQLLMLPNDHVERGTFKRINKDEAILKSEIFNADNEVVATQEINFTRIDSKPTEPGDKKLTAEEVEKILAAQIGQWQVKGQLKPANEEPLAYEFTLNVQWQEKGKSISSTGTLEKAGENISLFSSKEYDPSKGVFLFRFRDELRPEILSHEKYDQATQSFQGRQISPEEPEVTYTFQADGPDKFIFKNKTTRNGQLISTDETIQTRIATNNSSTEPKPNTPAKKLTAKQASEVMAWEIGSWEAKGQGQPAGGQPNPIAITREVRWKEEGKSLKYKFSLVENGKPVTYFGHQEYDAAMGVFVYRSKWGNNPETTSHDVYDVTTRTTQGRSMPAPSEGEPSTTTITKRVGDDRSEQTLEITQNGQVIYSHKIVSTRIKTAPIEPASGGDDKSAKIIEAAIRKASNKPTGELTKADYEKVALLDLVSKKLTDVKGLEKLTQLTRLDLTGNPDLTKAQIVELKKALPRCGIYPLTKEESAEIIEAAIRKAAKKPEGELTKADFEKVTNLSVSLKQLTDVSGLEKLTQLKELTIWGNQLTNVKGLEELYQLTNLNIMMNKLTDVSGLEKLTQLTSLSLLNNPDLTKAQIDQLQKALPNCKISSDPTK